MGKCCSKEEKETHQEEFQEVLLDVDPGGVEGGGRTTDNMTGGTLVVRSPGRWQVTTSRDIPITTTNKTTTKKVVTTGPQNGTGALVTKTYKLGNGGSATQSKVTYSGSGTKATLTKSIINTSSNQQRTAEGWITTTNKAGGNNISNNAKSVFSISTPKMGKTITETATRVYTKDGKRYQEIVETVTKEDDSGNVTKSTKTTTKELDSFDTTEMKGAIEADTRRSKGAIRKSSSSSNDASPERRSSKSHTKSEDKSKKSGFLSGLKTSSRGRKSSAGDSSDDEESFIEDVHKGINECRKKHGVKPLKISKEMNKYAKEWAKKLAKDERMAHRPDNKYGENVYCVSSNSSTFKINGSEVVDKWYSEIKDHIFGEEPKGSLLKSGHFSQMVWKDTKQVGIGYARSAAGTKIFVVANFDPRGNWMGQFSTQVPPLGGFSKSASHGKLTPSAVSSKSRKTSSSSTSSDSDEEDFAKDCLKAHNDYRKKHGVPPLKLNKQLNKFAEEWAKVIAKKNVLQHRDNNKYGENIYCAWSSNPNHKIKGKEAVDSWYSEIKDFTFGREPADLSAGHFTQVVWQDSKELGVGMARSSTGKIFVVANYEPAGNFVGSFASKVPRPK